MNPKVTFIVPCYKLAHLLPDCINSILKQTFRDFEILIMDDCSPDNTSDVAASFADPRIIHVRNETNLGGIKNYNKGISLARGQYVWLISADDYLRRPYILERYVDLFDQHPEVGYIFCPGVHVRNGKEIDVIRYSLHGTRDAIFKGRKLLSKLMQWKGSILAASMCVRKTCYETISLFPLNMIWGGDWYLCVIFAFHYDVGYFAEPMVCYREHELQMTKTLSKGDAAYMTAMDTSMAWIFKHEIEEAGDAQLVRASLDAAAHQYARSIADNRCREYPSPMTFEQFEESLCRNTSKEAERDYVRARIDAFLADEYYWKGEVVLARQFCSSALRKTFWTPRLWVRYMLFSSGAIGIALRRARADLTRLWYQYVVLDR
jgi:hypothetical protein